MTITAIRVKFINGRQLSPVEGRPRREDEARGSRRSVECPIAQNQGHGPGKSLDAHTVIPGRGRDVHFNERHHNVIPSVTAPSSSRQLYSYSLKCFV
jgi:hypothetical protein